MPDVLETLGTLPSHPPAPPVAADEIRRRAGRRSLRRRRRRAIAAIAAVSLGLVTVAAVNRAGDDRPKVTAGPPTTVRPAAEPPMTINAEGQVLLTEPFGMEITPAIGLGETDRVDIRLDPDPGGELIVVQCAAEVVEISASGPAGTELGVCSAVLQYLRGTADPIGRRPDSTDLWLDVDRRLGTADLGVIDCASAPGRCVVAVRPSGTTGAASGDDDRFAPLAFNSELGPLPTPTLTYDGGEPPFEDGQVVTLHGEDFAPEDDVYIRQCVATGQPATSEDTGVGDCDGDFRAVVTRTDADGRFSIDLLVYRDIGVGEYQERVSWIPCEPCALVVTGARSGTALAALELVPSDTPIHPSIRLVPEGPYRPGQRVRVEGSGFQASGDPGAEIHVAWCLTGADIADCVYPTEGMTPQVGSDGRFVIDAFPLPDSLSGMTCAPRPGFCAVAWHPSAEGAPMGQTIPLDLSG